MRKLLLRACRIGSKEALALALSYAADRSWDDTLLGSFKA